MQTAAGGGLVYDDGKNIERTNYNNWSKLSFVDKMKRRFNIAKHQFNESSSPIINSVEAIFGEYDPENPDLNTGIVNAPGRATPQQIQQSAKLMETINNYWKNLGKLKIRLGGNGKYASGILTKPGTAPTTFNGQNINYITSPKGGNVTHKFYTDQGSEYILTKDGFARRVKSSHANTGGADAGLHEWNKGATRFLDSDELGWSYQAWTDRTKPLGFSEKDGIISLVTNDNGKWRYVMRSELRPNAVKNGTIKDGIVQSAYTTEPKVGKWMLEYGTNPTGEINWFHPGSQVAFIEGLKQGGKMNILEFLKNGSGIYIKKKNRGSFTRWCGGNVTEECIRRGKASSNPKIRKKATFADNARHFKHRFGGKLFSFQEGGKTSFWQKAGNFLNGETGKGLLSLGAQIFGGLKTGSDIADFSNSFDQATDSKVKAMESKMRATSYQKGLQKAKETIAQKQSENPDVRYGEIDLMKMAQDFSNEFYDAEAIDNYKTQRAQEKLQQMQAIQGSASSGFADIIQNGLGMVGNFLNNKKSTTPTTTTSNNITQSLLNYSTIGKSTNPYMYTGLGANYNAKTLFS